MDAKKTLEHGAEFPYDASDHWWDYYNDDPPPPAKDWTHAAARGILADLKDRRGIGNSFCDIDEVTRVEIVESLAAIIREAAKEK